MDEAWLSSFVPSSSHREESHAHRRRASLLQPLDVCIYAPECRGYDVDNSQTVDKTDSEPTLGPSPIEEASARGPPSATILRRASSWHDLQRLRVRKRPSFKLERRSSLALDDRNDGYPVNVRNYIDIGMETELLDASHEDYECVLKYLKLRDFF